MIRTLLRTLGHLNRLRFGLRDRIIRALHNPDTCASEAFKVPFFGGVYSGDFDTFIDWSVYYYGAYAREELRLLDDILRTLEDPVVLDVGANVGHHTLYAAMRAKQVIGFEPFPEVAEKLETKIRENQLANVLLLPCGLGEKNQTAVFVKPSGHNTGTGSFARPAEGGETLMLPIRIGDELLAEQRIHDIHLVKIDVEGFEPFVLRGLAKTMARCRPVVFFEWTQRERGLFDADPRGLFPDDYLFLRFLSDTVVLHLFRKRSYRLSLLSDAPWPDGNLLAVPKERLNGLRTNPRWRRLSPIRT